MTILALPSRRQSVAARRRLAQIERYRNHQPCTGRDSDPFCPRHAIWTILAGRYHDAVGAGLALPRKNDF
jgi:hypothetical protein